MKIKSVLVSLLTLLIPATYSAPFVEVNHALTGTASQSSILEGRGAELAIDGKTEAAWGGGSVTHTQQDDPAWWELDLGAAKPIGRLQIWFRSDCCFDRNDNLTYTILDAGRAEVWKQEFQGHPANILTFTLPAPVQGQFVRIESREPRYLSLAEVQVIAPYTGVNVTFSTPPADANIFENQTATFGPVGVTAEGVEANKFSFQWQRNGQDIPGATSASYTTAPLTVADSGAEFSVKALLPGLTVAGPKAKVTVTRDETVPTIASVSSTGGTSLQFQINFSELIDPATATNKNNYVFAGGATVLNAILQGPTVNTNNNSVYNSVLLSVVGLPANTNYSLAISGIKDLSGANTLVATNLAGEIGFYEINHARGGTAAQSSNLDAVHVASLGIDGNLNQAWAGNSVTHTLQDDPPWWEVDLGASKEIARVAIYWRTDFVAGREDDFTLLVLDAARKEIARRQYTGRPPRIVFYDFQPPVQGQIVRLEGQTPRTTSDGYFSVAEVEVLAAYQNASLSIASPPADASALEGRPLTLGPAVVNVTGAPTNKLSFQWQKNGVDIPGAMAATYTIPVVLLTDNGAEYGVRVSLPGHSAVSGKAKLTVVRDVEPPTILSVDSAAGAESASFRITFNELMDAESANNAANYSLGTGVTVTEATLQSNGRSVLVVATGLGNAPRFNLAITGVKDLAGNAISAGTISGSLQTNYALAGTASQSSTIEGRGAELAIDGNLNQAWGGGSVTHTGNADDPPVWEVDLGAVKTVGSVRIYFRSDCCQERNEDFTLYLIEEDRTKFVERNYPGRPPLVTTLNFAPPVQARYVRIHGQTPARTTGKYMSLAEVQVLSAFTGDTIAITGGVTNQTALENERATFGPIQVNAPGVEPSKITYQWQRNGTNIPGAFAATYTTPPLTQSDNGGEYSVTALLPGISSAPVKATLSVTSAVKLAATAAGGVFRLTWPVSATGFALEATDSLSPPAWRVATETSVVTDTNNVVTLQSPAGRRFYRLIRR